MPTTISQVQICNMALARIGVKPIQALDTPDDIPSEQCLLNWEMSRDVVSRSHQWNCLIQPLVLVEVVQDPIIPPDPTPAATAWAPLTAYAAGAYVRYGDPAYLYQALIANVSTAVFTNDLTSGFWFQTDIGNTSPFGDCDGENYASGWAFKYQLPEDCLLVVALNDRPCEGREEDFEIMGSCLYTDEERAIIKYVQAVDDTTRYDALFTECLVLHLAAAIATVLRQDDTSISIGFARLYLVALGKARAKDGGEKRPRRFDPVANSRFVGSRFWSTNR